MKKKIASLVLAAAGVLSVCGCGTSATPPPSGAVMHAAGPGKAAPQHQGAWTKADKIAVIQKSSMTDDQKTAAIAQVNAGPGN